MSKPMRCIKANVSDLQDPKRLAVLKAIFGSPIHGYSSRFVFVEPLVSTPFLVTSIFVSIFLKEILIHIPTIKLEPRLLIGESVKLHWSTICETKSWCKLEGDANKLLRAFNRDDLKIRITEETLKEIGFEIVEIDDGNS